jgi:sec-independent protein translocase protein TatB
MFDLELSKMALIGAVALIVIGPEKLPRVARMVGTMLGRAQRYVSDVKAEVNRAIDADELKRIKEAAEQAGRDVQNSLQEVKTTWQKDFSSVGSTLSGSLGSTGSTGISLDKDADGAISFQSTSQPEPLQYQHPGKNWRIRRGARPQWYKERSNMRRNILSASARVARYRPKRMPEI